MIPNFVNGNELAKILRITHQRISQLVAEGVLRKKEDGKFNLSEAIDKYYFFKYGPTSDYTREHALHEKAKREKAELSLAIMKGELHKASDIEFVMTNMLTVFRTRILGIPSILAPIIVGLKNVNKVKELLDLRLREALTELSEYDPALFSPDGVIENEQDEEDQL